MKHFAITRIISQILRFERVEFVDLRIVSQQPRDIGIVNRINILILMTAIFCRKGIEIAHFAVVNVQKRDIVDHSQVFSRQTAVDFQIENMLRHFERGQDIRAVKIV